MTEDRFRYGTKMETEAVEHFLEDLDAVFKKHSMGVSSCNCCGSPWITTLAADGVRGEDRQKLINHLHASQVYMLCGSQMTFYAFVLSRPEPKPKGEHLELWLHPHEERERAANHLVESWEEFSRRYRYGRTSSLAGRMTDAVDRVHKILCARYQLPDICDENPPQPPTDP
jgi:hypothetical protein